MVQASRLAVIPLISSSPPSPRKNLRSAIALIPTLNGQLEATTDFCEPCSNGAISGRLISISYPSATSFWIALLKHQLRKLRWNEAGQTQQLRVLDAPAQFLGLKMSFFSYEPKASVVQDAVYAGRLIHRVK